MSMTGSTTDIDSEDDTASLTQETGQFPETIQSPRAKLVYLYLRTVKEAQVAELQRALDMQALALYPILEMLVNHELVERADDGYIITREYDQ